jgi:hypothetical protein
VRISRVESGYPWELTKVKILFFSRIDFFFDSCLGTENSVETVLLALFFFFYTKCSIIVKMKANFLKR